MSSVMQPRQMPHCVSTCAQVENATFVIGDDHYLILNFALARA